MEKLRSEGFREEWRKDAKESDEELFHRLMKRRDRVIEEVKHEIRRLRAQGTKPRREEDWTPIEEKKLIEFETKHSVTIPGDVRALLLGVGPVYGFETLFTYPGSFAQEPFLWKSAYVPSKEPGQEEILAAAANFDLQSPPAGYPSKDHMLTGPVAICQGTLPIGSWDVAVPPNILSLAPELLLVVSGPQRGQLWANETWEAPAIFPCTDYVDFLDLVEKVWLPWLKLTK